MPIDAEEGRNAGDDSTPTQWLRGVGGVADRLDGSDATGLARREDRSDDGDDRPQHHADDDRGRLQAQVGLGQTVAD